jgi:signal transduction histidine kinase
LRALPYRPAVVAAVGPLDTPKVLSALPYGVVVVDRDWRVTFANHEAERLLGRDGVTLWDRCPQLEATVFANAFRYAMADRAELISETVLPVTGWVQARARPLEDGLLISLRAIFPDTSESLQMRQGILAGEIGYALTRATSMREMLQDCADALVRHFGARLVRIWRLDAKARELVHEASAGGASDPELPARVAVGRAKIGKIAERGVPHLTNDFQNDPRAGDRTWAQREGIVAFAGYPLRLAGDVLGVLGVYGHLPFGHEVTSALTTVADSSALGIERKLADDARKAAETELRTQAEQLELINEIGKNLTSELEIGPLVQRVTNLATRLAGASYGMFYVGDVSGEAFGLLAAANVARESLPFRLRRSQLAPQTFADRLPTTSFLVTPVIARGGRSLGALIFGHEHAGVFTEATERLLDGVAAQAAIAIDNARLFDDARRLIVTLERKNAELDQFAYVASHDLKAPLRGIANLSQWIEDDLGDRMDEQARYHMRLLRGRVTRLEGLIDGILHYSRAGRSESEASEVETRSFVQEIWELLGPPSTAQLVLGELPTQLFTARVPLQQVLMNLIGNAIKYNGERELTVEVGARGDTDLTTFYVKDNGVGIPPEFHDRIWGLFQTLEARDRLESTGIGLAVVRKIVEARGGRAWVESAAGAGATFWFTWPAESVRISDG